MSGSPADALFTAMNAYIDAPTADNRAALVAAADVYREHWIVAQAAKGRSRDAGRAHTVTPTTYDRQLEVTRLVSGIPVKLALQERTSATEDQSWWVLSWRTKYSADGSNRRFYLTKAGGWTIPAGVALEMMEEMESLGGLDDKYLDLRASKDLKTLTSPDMTATERSEAFAKLTGPDEDWGRAPLFVISADPNDQWKKVLIVDTTTDTATFRSITENADYMPKKVLRPGEGWWLDNSMMDANVQQTRVFLSSLREYLANRTHKKRGK